MDKQDKLNLMIMKLFSLKGKTGYTEFDIQCWREVIQKYDINKIAIACNKCIRKKGFFEIEMLLEELDSNPVILVEKEWDRIWLMSHQYRADLKQLAPEVRKALDKAGGMQKLRTAKSDYERKQIKDKFFAALLNDTSRRLIE